jgi:hypothetical protein
MSGQSTDGTERSIRERLKCKIHGHDWTYRWADRQKECYHCGANRPIEKEYDHEDESVNIGDTRIRVNESHGQFRVERERYTKTGHGPDDAYFQWFPDGGFCADESDLIELRKQINRSVDTATDQQDGVRQGGDDS